MNVAVFSIVFFWHQHWNRILNLVAIIPLKLTKNVSKKGTFLAYIIWIYDILKSSQYFFWKKLWHFMCYHWFTWYYASIGLLRGKRWFLKWNLMLCRLVTFDYQLSAPMYPSNGETISLKNIILFVSHIQFNAKFKFLTSVPISNY